MLIPKFSIRWMLAVTVIFALIFLVAKYAMAGDRWAIAIMVAIGMVTALMAAFALMFMVVAFLVKVVPVRRGNKVESPFAADRLPPQVIATRDVEAR